MNIEFWTKSKAHRDAIAKLTTLVERLRYIVDHADKPKYRAAAMINIEEGMDFYCPRLGPFIIRRFGRMDCARKTTKQAAREADIILEALVRQLKIETTHETT